MRRGLLVNAAGPSELALMAGCVLVAVLALVGDALMLRAAWRGGACERVAAAILVPLATGIGVVAAIVLKVVYAFAQCEANVGGDCLQWATTSSPQRYSPAASRTWSC
jgi:hypothetical protein